MLQSKNQNLKTEIIDLQENCKVQNSQKVSLVAQKVLYKLSNDIPLQLSKKKKKKKTL